MSGCSRNWCRRLPLLASVRTCSTRWVPLGDRRICWSRRAQALVRCPRRCRCDCGFAAESTAHFYFILRDWDGTLDRIHETLYVAVREAVGRALNLSAAIIDLQSARVAQKGDLRSLRRASMRARRSPADSATSSSIRSVLLGVSILPAHNQDRDGANALLRRVRRCFPFIDRPTLRGRGLSGAENCQGRVSHRAWENRDRQAHRSPQLRRFAERWIVERTFVWISRNRRLARDFEATTSPSPPSSASP
jgi:hypothetical protein